MASVSSVSTCHYLVTHGCALDASTDYSRRSSTTDHGVVQEDDEDDATSVAFSAFSGFDSISQMKAGQKLVPVDWSIPTNVTPRYRGASSSLLRRCESTIVLDKLVAEGFIDKFMICLQMKLGTTAVSGLFFQLSPTDPRTHHWFISSL